MRIGQDLRNVFSWRVKWHFLSRLIVVAQKCTRRPRAGARARAPQLYRHMARRDSRPSEGRWHGSEEGFPPLFSVPLAARELIAIDKELRYTHFEKATYAACNTRAPRVVETWESNASQGAPPAPPPLVP